MVQSNSTCLLRWESVAEFDSFIDRRASKARVSATEPKWVIDMRHSSTGVEVQVAMSALAGALFAFLEDYSSD
jgi:hypothetical protein